MPSKKPQNPAPVKPPATEMTTDEAVRFLFPERLIDEAKRRVEEPPRKKGEPPKKSMNEL
jgi:hypothetical protein